MHRFCIAQLWFSCFFPPDLLALGVQILNLAHSDHFPGALLEHTWLFEVLHWIPVATAHFFLGTGTHAAHMPSWVQAANSWLTFKLCSWWWLSITACHGTCFSSSLMTDCAQLSACMSLTPGWFLKVGVGVGWCLPPTCIYNLALFRHSLQVISLSRFWLTFLSPTQWLGLSLHTLGSILHVQRGSLHPLDLPLIPSSQQSLKTKVC
jgi:hypothetical protein